MGASAATLDFTGSAVSPRAVLTLKRWEIRSDEPAFDYTKRELHPVMKTELMKAFSPENTTLTERRLQKPLCLL